MIPIPSDAVVQRRFARRFAQNVFFLYHPMMMNNFSRQLQKLIKEDQDNIKGFYGGKISQEMLMDRSNNISAVFLGLINKFGFPYKNTDISEEDYKSGIALALHLSLPQLKNVYSGYIEKSLNEQVLPEHKIVFIDKIRILSGQPQLYGSQFRKIIKNKIEFLPIEDIENVDQRRREMGIPPLSEYIKQIS